MTRQLKYLAVFLCSLVLAESFSVDLNHIQDVVLRNKRYAYRKPETCQLNGINDNLCFYGSRTVPYQMAVLNTTASTGVVIDNSGGKVSFMDGNSGNAVILDRNTNTGVTIPGKTTYAAKFSQVLTDYNVTHAYHQNYESAFQFNEYGIQPSERVPRQGVFVNSVLLSVVHSFGKDFSDYVNDFIATSGGMVKGVIGVFAELMKPIMTVLAPIVVLATSGWLKLMSGLKAIFKVVSTVAEFVVRIGIKMLVGIITIPLGMILVALNGLMAFFLILYEIAKKIILADILGFILMTPIMVIQLIAGLGGMVLCGIAGIFTIVARIIGYLTKGVVSIITSSLNFLSNMVLSFFGFKHVSRTVIHKDVTEGSSLLLDLFTAQSKKPSARPITPMVDIAAGIHGSKPLLVNRVDVGKAVHILADPSVPNGIAMTASLLAIFNPLKIPNMLARSMSSLLSSSVRLLADNPDPVYIEGVLPGLALPPGAIQSFPSQTLPLLELPTREIIMKVPQLKSVFTLLDKNAIQVYNVSLYDQLDKDPYFNNEINLAIRRVIAAD